MLHHLNLPEGFSDWVLTHRTRVLIVYLVMTVAAASAALQVPIHVSLIKGVMSDESQYQAYRERAKKLGGDSDDLLFVATREDSLFSKPTLNAIRSAARELEKLDEIQRVFSIVDAPRLAPKERSLIGNEELRATVRKLLHDGQLPDLPVGLLKLPKYWPDTESAQSEVDLTEIEKSFKSDPISGRLIAADGSAHAMLVWLADASAMRDQPGSGIREKIKNVLERHHLGESGFYCSGTLVILDSMFKEVRCAVTEILPAVAVIVSLLVFLTFRRLSYVVLTMVIAGIAIIWTLGVVAVLFGEITLLVAATPALIMIISTADTIHLVSAYVAELKSGLSREAAIRKVFQEVGGACVLTSVTTFVGFLSMMVVPAATLRHMAVAAAVGVASALLLALTLVPMTLTILKPPPTGDSANSPINRVLDYIVNVCKLFCLSWPRTVLLAHIIVIAASIGLALQLQHDADLPGRFQKSHHLRQSIDFFNNEMFGTSTIELILHADRERMFANETLSGLAQLEENIRESPSTRDVISILSVFRSVDHLIDLKSKTGLPQDRQTTEAIVRLSHQVEPNAIRGLISEDANLSRIAVQVDSTRMIEVTEIGERFVEVAREVLPEEVEVELSGYYFVVGNAVREIMKSQLQGFALCFASVMAIVTLGVRSIRLGLLAVLPNLFPLTLLGGFIGLAYEMMDSDFLGIAIVSFGLAVDDTIHFLHRYDIETATAGDHRSALEATFRYTGSAIIRTTVILGVGLLPFALSDYLSIYLLGSYLVGVLAFAILGDLLLLPAMILLFGGNGEKADQSA